MNNGDPTQKDDQEGISGDPFSCQMKCLPRMSTAIVKTENQSIRSRLMLARKRFLGYRIRHTMRKTLNKFLRTIKRILGIADKQKQPLLAFPTLDLKPGEYARIRSYEEIQATLDYRRNYKGCGFMAGMMQYCGTTQRVLKPVRKFIDERDHRLKKGSGLVFLDGLNCQGEDMAGGCDRACFYFWREEWLERIESKTKYNVIDKVAGLTIG